jgi:CBS domain-containing protein
MRHLFVVDAHNNVVGMITREDLDRAAGHGWWRVAPIAEQPKKKSVGKIMSKVFGLGFASRGNQPPTTPTTTPMATAQLGEIQPYKPPPSRLGQHH